ncbi:hypothetical protein ACQP0U_21475 [Micromonospora sp. CA-269861]|uniref:hypothetical protein n=1 Tax=Micromonospora sp. CA-269861 TaxID=3239968 RepID=UPI003D8E2D60
MWKPRDLPAAIAALHEAVTILEPLGDRRLDEMRGRLSELLSDRSAASVSRDAAERQVGAADATGEVSPQA